MPPVTPLLDKVSSPADTRGFNITQLKQLADELRAETAARKIELLLASLHDLPDPTRTSQPPPRRPDRDQDRDDDADRRPRFVRRRPAREGLEAAE